MSCRPFRGHLPFAGFGSLESLEARGNVRIFRHIWNCGIIVHQHVVKNTTVADSNTCPEVPATASQVCGRLLMDSLCIE